MSSRSTTPDRCTGTFASSATACSCPGRCPRACRWTGASTISPFTWRTTHSSTAASRARSLITSTAPAPSRSGTAGRYECSEWTDDDVKVTLHGSRVEGRYGLFRTDGDNWMIHRDRSRPGGLRAACPTLVRPMLATAVGRAARQLTRTGPTSSSGTACGPSLYVEGGRVRALSRTDRDVTASYPGAEGPRRGARLAPSRARRRDRGPGRERAGRASRPCSPA